jgi:hypothetical protein
MEGSSENKEHAGKEGQAGKADSRIIKEGGYQPTTDPGPVPEILVRPGVKPQTPASNSVSAEIKPGSGEPDGKSSED